MQMPAMLRLRDSLVCGHAASTTTMFRLFRRLRSDRTSGRRKAPCDHMICLLPPSNSTIIHADSTVLVHVGKRQTLRAQEGVTSVLSPSSPRILIDQQQPTSLSRNLLAIPVAPGSMFARTDIWKKTHEGKRYRWARSAEALRANLWNGREAG